MMTSEPSPRPIAPLTRMVRPRRRAGRLAWLAAVAVLAIELVVPPVLEPDCRSAARHGRPADAVAACERAYLRSDDPALGLLLADAQRRAGNLAVADAIASGLLVSPLRADALAVLGEIALAEGQLEVATTALTNARALHRAEHRHAALARDASALAAIARSRRADPRPALHECIAEAHAAADPWTEAACRIAAAREAADTRGIRGD